MADERVYAPAPRGRTRGGDGVVRRGEEEKAREEDTRREIEALMRELDAGEEDDAEEALLPAAYENGFRKHRHACIFRSGVELKGVS